MTSIAVWCGGRMALCVLYAGPVTVARTLCDTSRTSDGLTALPYMFCVALVMLFHSASASAADGDAQLPQSISPGMRVRILAPEVSPSKIIGTVNRVSDGSMTLDVPGRNEPVSILREKIARLEVSGGPRSRGIDSAIGAGIGAGIGAAGCALANRSGRGHIVSSGEIAGVCALFGAGLGGLIGVAVPPGERWREVPATRYQVRFEPRLDHGLDLAVVWRF
jgi:hypothetical protein